jgi:RNA polymerase sigma-70 factor, ECF subfamily
LKKKSIFKQPTGFLKRNHLLMSFLSNKKNIETEVITLLAQGDKKAISLAYKNYADALFGIIVRIVKTKEIAEEVLQDTFVKVWDNASKFDESKGRLFTWFANIARNTAIDMVRSARYQKLQKTDTLENPVHTNTASVANIEIRDSGLEKVINSMDEKYRKIIDKLYFEGYSHSELAKEMDIPLGTVKSRLRLAIKELRQKLDGDFLTILLIILLFLAAMV